MSGELRLTVGELGYAIGVVATLRRALDFLRNELGVFDENSARAVLAASSHSLVARGMATRGESEVRLAPPLRTAAEIAAASEWALRCERVTGERVESLTFHLASGGILAQAVEDEVVLRLARETRIERLVDRVSAFFELPPSDEWTTAPVRIERAAMRELGRLHERADVAAELARYGVPRATSVRFAAALASARWKGSISTTCCRRSEEPTGDVVFALVAGVQTWFIDTRNAEFALLGIASHEYFSQAARATLCGLDPAVRALDGAGELDG
jgi:hypothetical protein